MMNSSHRRMGASKSSNLSEEELRHVYRLQAEARAEIQRRKKARVDAQADRLKAWKKDFIGFAKKLDVIDKYSKRMKVEQTPILRAFENARTGYDYVLKARQVFMTTWELARDIWFFMVNPNANVTVLAPSSNDNKTIKTLSDRIQVMFEGLQEEYPDADFIKSSETKWEHRNGTGVLTILGAGATLKAAQKKARGGTIQRLHVTEVSFFEFAFETLTALLASIPPDDGIELPDGSRRFVDTEIVFETTAQGATGAFFEGYMGAREGKTKYHAHFFPWYMQPEYSSPLKKGETIYPHTEREKQLLKNGISQEQLKWYQMQVADPMKGGQAKIDQEYPSDEESCWLFDGRLFFDVSKLAKLRTDAEEPIGTFLRGACKVWKKPERGKTYILVIDPSSGAEADEEEAKKKKLDPTAFIVLERETGAHCATFHGYFHPDDAANKAAFLGWYYNQATIAVERSSSHGTIHDTLRSWVRINANGVQDKEVGVGYPNIYVAEDNHYGFVMSPQSRPAILDGLEVAIRNDRFITRDLDFIKEAQLFIVKKGKPEATTGAHDDRIIAAAIAWKLTQIPLGLNASVFASAPSIAFENTPISFENMAVQGADNIVQSELRKWAGATNNVTNPTPGLSLIYMDNSGSTEGF